MIQKLFHYFEEPNNFKIHFTTMAVAITPTTCDYDINSNDIDDRVSKRRTLHPTHNIPRKELDNTETIH